MRFILLFCFFSISLVRAQLVPEALAMFPANTTSLEFDNLAALRKVPNYQELRRQYSSEALNRVKQTLFTLGIPEDQLSEVVTASGPNGFFGLLEGNFNANIAAKNADEHNFSHMLLDGGPAFCSPNAVCVSFPGHSSRNAVFGSLEQLRIMLETSRDHAPALGTNPMFARLLDGLDHHAPVMGIAPGSEIGELIKNVVPQNLSSFISLQPQLAEIKGFGYSIDIDFRAHLTADLLCQSESASSSLSTTINTASRLQEVARLAMDDVLPFRNLKATSAGPLVKLSLDAKLKP